MSRPILFLDVDGVLNCYGARFPRARPEGGRGAQLHVPEGTKERIATLLGYFDPVWATAWRRGAHKTFAPILELPLKPWPCIDYRDAKLPHLIRYAGERPWAWVDDDGEWELEHATHADKLAAERGLIVSPQTDVGLTDEHVAALVAFAHG